MRITLRLPIVAILLLNFIFFTTSAQNWFALTSGVSADLKGVHFPTPSTGYAVGMAGTIIKTTNGGANWSTLTSGTATDLYCTHFVSDNVGFAGGVGGLLRMTTDGGGNWSTISTPMTNDIFSLYFVDSNTGFACGDMGKIMKTTNGGTTWSMQTSGVSSILHSIRFFDMNNGMAAGAGGIAVKTTNGGSTWSQSTTGATDNVLSVFFTSGTTAYIAGDLGLFKKTTNGGSSWTNVTHGQGTPLFHSIYFTSMNDGYVGLDNGDILKTVDGSTTWSVMSTGGTEARRSLHFPNPNQGYAVGFGGKVLKIDYCAGFSASAGAPSTICSGISYGIGGVPTATGGTSPYAYAWNPSGDLNSSTVANPVASPTTTTDYTVTVTDNIGCQVKSQVLITVNPTPSAPIVSDNSPVCSGQTLNLNASFIAGATYSWSGPMGFTSSLQNPGITNVATAAAGSYSVYATLNGCNGPTGTKTVTVNQTPAVPTASNSGPVCEGQDLSLNASFIAGGVSYNWSGPNAYTSSAQNNYISFATPAASGVYNVTASQNGCTSAPGTTNATVNAIPAAPSAGVVSTVVCAGGDLSLTASNIGGASYAWTGPNAFSSSIQNPILAFVQVGSTGTYSVTATVAGCTGAPGTIFVTANDTPSVSISKTDPSCFGGTNGGASAITSGGVGPYTFMWSTSEVTQNISNLGAGSYSVTLTDYYGCGSKNDANVLEPADLAITLNAYGVSCFGGANGQIDALVTGGTGIYTYQWSTTETTSSAYSLVPGSYSVDVTDQNGCIKSDAAIVTEPTQVVQAVTVVNATCNGLCNGKGIGGATGGTPPYNYGWMPMEFNGDSVLNLCAGTSYTVNVSDFNNCTVSYSFTITEPAVLIADGGTGQTICAGSSGVIGGSPAATGGTAPYAYSWNPATGLSSSTIDNPIASPASTTNYYLVVTDNNNCVDTSGNVNVTVNALPSVNISGPTNVSCNGGSDGSATATGAVSYAWSNSQTTPTASNLAAGSYTVTGTDASGCAASATVAITQPAALGISTFNPVNPSCSGAANGSISPAYTGGTAPYSYSWSNGATTAAISNLTAGSYSVTLTDINGCVFNDYQDLTTPAALTLTVTPVNVACNGGSNGSASVNVSGGTAPYSYAWTTGPSQSTQTATGLSAGTYSVTVTDATGCSASGSANITQPSTFVYGIGSQAVTCSGGTNGYAVETITSGGTPPFTYAWSNGATTDSIYNLAAGNYSVTVTDNNGCGFNDAVTITTLSALTLTVSSTPALCNGGNSGTATATASGGPSPYTFSWSSGATTVTASNLAAGTHTVNVWDSYGCTTSQTVAVTSPSILSVTATPTAATCNGGSNGMATAGGAGGTTPYAYSWSPSGGTAPTASNLAAGNYTVTVTDNNSCTATATIAITQPAVLAVSISPANASCNGSGNGTATANVTGGTVPYVYSWNTGASTQSASNLSAGTYTVVVTDANNCNSTATVAITQPTAMTVTTTAVNNACYGNSSGSATANVSGGTPTYTYVWSNGQTVQTAPYLSAGNFAVTVTDANGCSVTDSISITQALPVPITVSVTPTSCGLSTGSATASVSGPGSVPPFTYLWTTGSTSAAVNGLSAGVYRANVTDGNGCFSFADALIENSNGPTLTLNSVTDISCNGLSDGSVTVNISGGSTPYTFEWSNGASTQNITGLSYGPYELKAADASGCIAQLSVMVNEPAALALTTTVVPSACKASTGSATALVTGGTLPYNYAWSSGSTTSLASAIPAGVYTITVTDSRGCSILLLTAVSDVNGPAAVVDTVAAANCGGGGFAVLNPADLGAISGYNWSNGTNSQNLSNATPGNYGVLVTDTSGCKSALIALVDPVLPPVKPICLVSVDSTSTYNIIVWDKPLSSVTAGFNIFRESSSSGIYQKVGFVPYASLSQFYDSIVDPDDRWAKYRISMKDVCGKDGPLSPEHKTIHLALQSVTANTTNIIWDEHEGYAFTQYDVYRKANSGGPWVMIGSVPAGGTTTYSDNTFLPGDTSYYRVEVDHPGGCVASSNEPTPDAVNLNSSKSNIYRVYDSTLTHMYFNAQDRTVIVYPNPSSGVFTIATNHQWGGAEVRIFNALGEEVKRISMPSKSGKVQVDLSRQAKGMYHIQVINGNSVSHKNILIQ